jgi:hypothetical protein
VADQWDGWESAEDLLALAKAAGFEPTRNQMIRWHKRGLLPRPKVRYRLGRRGGESMYPPGTSSLFLDVCGLEATRTSIDTVGWELWWAGHDRDMIAVRAFFEDVCDDFDSTLAKIRPAIRSGEAAPGSRWKVRDFLNQ